MLLGLRQLRDVEFVSSKGYGSEQLRQDQGLTFVNGQGHVSESMVP